MGDPLLKIDAVALLKSIRDIEHQLTEYHRQDKVPKWGEELLHRLDRVEQTRDVQSSQGSRESKSSGSNSITLQDLTNDERIIRKVRSDIDSDLNFIKGSCETKVSGLSLEVDRLHKLLSSRPTNTELQQVVLSIQHVDNKIQDSVHEITSTIGGIVSDRVSSEMASLLKEIAANKDLNLESVNVVSKKIDSFQMDIGNMRQGIHEFQGSIQSQLSSSEIAIKDVRGDIATLQKSFDEDALKVEKAFAEVRYSQNMATETFNDYKASMISKLLDTDADLKLQKSLLQDTIKVIDTTQTTYTQKIEDLKGNFDKLKQDFAEETNQVKVDIKEVVSAVEDLQERQTQLETFVKQITEFNIFDVVNKVIDGLSSQDEKFEAQAQTMALIQAENEKLNDAAKLAFEQVDHVRETLVEHSTLIGKLQEEDKRLDTATQVVDETVNRIEKELSRLSTVSGELSMLREQMANTEQRVKLNNTNLADLSATSSDHDRRIEELIETLDKNVEHEVKRMDELRGDLMDMLKQKSAEMEATLQNMKDNIEIISQAQEATGASKARGTINKGNLSGRMGGGGMAGNIGGAGPAAGGGPGGEISDEEKQFNSGKAQFIADLAINYEEIAIKKTFVPEIPPAMREHLTSLGQDLTAYIADITDADMVQRQLQDTPDDMEFYTNIIAEMRSKKVDAFISDVREIVVSNNPQPGIIRHDARDKFLKLLRKALELCMTKHDQVLNVGSSRLGRIKVPTCIACDRPLLEKSRVDTIAKSNNDVLMRHTNSINDDTPEQQSLVKRANRPQSGVNPKGGQLLKLPSAVNPVGRPTTAGLERQMSDMSVGSHNNSAQAMILKPGVRKSNNNLSEVSKSYSALPDL